MGASSAMDPIAVHHMHLVRWETDRILEVAAGHSRRNSRIGLLNDYIYALLHPPGARLVVTCVVTALTGHLVWPDWPHGCSTERHEESCKH